MDISKIAKEVKNEALRKKILEYFRNNPNPTDTELHKFVEKNEYDIHEIETEVYKLTTDFVQFLFDGRSMEKGITEKDVDQNELKIGIEIEKEHTSDKDIAKRIALDHLAENLNVKYYTELRKMEKNIGID